MRAVEEPTPAASGSEVVNMEAISVTDRSETRANSTLPKIEIQAQAIPGMEPMLVLRSLPGVMVQTNDTLGLYEFGASVRLRAFDINQIAFDIDGVPMGRNDERGNRVSRFLDAETMDSIKLSQGSGDVSTPAYSALGGAIHYFTANPLSQMGVEANFTTGSNQLYRYFVRADTGSFLGGYSGYLAVSQLHSDVSYGPGSVQRFHVESKFEKQFGIFKVTAAYKYNDRFDHDVFSIAKTDWYNHNYAVLFAGYTGDPSTDTANYERWINARRDHLVNLNVEGQITPDLKVTFVPYYQNQRGRGTAWQDSVASSVSGPDRLLARQEIQKSNREGLTGRAEYNLDFAGIPQTVAAGFWVEHEGYSRVRIAYELGGPGSALAGYKTPPPYIDLSRPLYYIYYHSFNNSVLQYYIEDKLKLLDNKLTVNFGIKALDVTRDFHGIPNRTYFNAYQTFAYRKKTFVNDFSPQIGASYALTSTEQVFANYAHNYSVPGFNYFTDTNYDPTTKSETSDNVDFGIRTSRGGIDASLTGYYVAYHNRLLDVTPATDSAVANRGLVGQPVLQNVGNVETKGIEAALAWKPIRSLRLSTSISYTDSKFQQNYYNGTDLVHVKDKRTPQVPVLSIQSSADYIGPYGFTVGLTEQTIGKRYSTFLNDEYAPGYTVFSARAGWENKKGYGLLKDVFARVTIDNLLNKNYLGEIDGVVVSSADGAYYYQGAPRTVYFTIGGKF